MDFSILTPQNLITTIAVIFLVYEIFDRGSKIVSRITAEHDRMKKWDTMEEQMLKNIQAERDKIYARYDVKLEEIEGRIEDNHIETEAKIQQTQSELYILTQCMSAVLDGLKQMNCNGPVTEAKEMLDSYLVRRAHEQ